jgi:hypothetical protein
MNNCTSSSCLSSSSLCQVGNVSMSPCSLIHSSFRIPPAISHLIPYYLANIRLAIMLSLPYHHICQLSLSNYPYSNLPSISSWLQHCYLSSLAGWTCNITADIGEESWNLVEWACASINLLQLHEGSGGDGQGWRFGVHRAARQLETACLPPPPLFFALSPFALSLLPLPSLSLSSSALLPPFSPPSSLRLATRAPPFHSTSAAGSHPASPPPPARPRNRRVPWCFSAATASAAGRPLAALPAAKVLFEVIFL